ncbi:hypothetical protein [Streptomyces sp. NPDC004783]|uniref:hypothetical protein n=1 Tax=Streptomyces sp. NPDC004783 TaxID=3154459 RepID=UPI0033BEEBC5
MPVTTVPFPRESIVHVRPADALLHADDQALAGPLAALGLEVIDVEPGDYLWVGEPDIEESKAGGYDEETQRQLLGRRRPDHDFGPEAARVVLPPATVARVKVNAEPGGMQGRALVHRLTQVTDGVDVGGYALLSPCQ